MLDLNFHEMGKKIALMNRSSSEDQAENDESVRVEEPYCRICHTTQVAA